MLVRVGPHPVVILCPNALAVANLASSFSVLSKPTSGTTATNEADSTADGSPADVVSSETSGTAPNTVAAKGAPKEWAIASSLPFALLCGVASTICLAC